MQMTAETHNPCIRLSKYASGVNYIVVTLVFFNGSAGFCALGSPMSRKSLRASWIGLPKIH